MSTRVVERVDDWPERPFDGGYRELQTLAESAFSGVVRAGGAELFMTRGVVVGIRHGSIDDFEDGSGTVYDAPTDPLPLLAVMQERSDEVRAKYYSEDTGLSEVDRTLESGGFTGFVELSENVLSGDYSLVYHQGHSMSVAYVGNTQQLLTGDDAFERADDEVGIYEVRPVGIEAIEIPDPPEPEPEPDPDPVPDTTPDTEEVTEAAPTTVENPEPEPTPTVVEPDTDLVDDPGTESAPSTTDGPPAESASSSTPVPPGEGSPEDPDAGSPTDTDDGTESTEAGQTAGTASAEHDDTHHTTTDSATAGQSTETDPSEPLRPGNPGAESGQAGVSTPDPPAPDADTQELESTEGAADTEPGAPTGQAAAARTERPRPDDAEPEAAPGDDASPAPTPARADSAVSGIEAEETPADEDPVSLETRAIPSLDPERTSTRKSPGSSEPRRDAPGRGETNRSGAGTAHSQSTGRREESRREPSSNRKRQPGADRTPRHEETETEETASTSEATADEAGTDPGSKGQEPDGERIDELQELLAERETEITRLESSLDTAASERDSVRRELESVRAERDELRDRVETLETELERLEEELGAVTDAQRRMTPQEALSGTDVFVRYRSKGDATLEKAHQSGAVKNDVVENLRLENHTQFDADISAVGGREYGQFLEETVAYRFVRWVVEDLIFEIQGTGHTESLSDLYEALPKINRVELNGAVNVTYAGDSSENHGTETFDVVFRERMGDPLLVANINDSRQGASEAMMEGLITAAERVGQTTDQFASAFLVTESFFEPEALETVAEATRGGLLSRDKRRSFVNLSRKRGYHLCLVEARNQNFHLEVPEL